MSTILAFRHTPCEHLGLIGEALAARGIACEYVDLFEDPERDPPVTDASALIFMGGPMSANDELPYLQRELRFIAQAISRNKPVLGVCLGAQLIAKALGAPVYENAVKEIGWAPVYWTEAAREDPLLTGLSGPEQMFHWHGETFDLPHGSEWLAYSDGCRNQAFRVGSNIYGFQFHIEVTPEMIADWCSQDAHCGDRREITTAIDPHANAARLKELSGLIFDRWCNLVESHSCREQCR